MLKKRKFDYKKIKKISVQLIDDGLIMNWIMDDNVRDDNVMHDYI